jgi:hypothetical protein
MKIIVLIIGLLILVSPVAQGQEFRINNAFVVVINDKPALSLSSPRLILCRKDGSKKIINADYVPGDLFCINKEDKDEISSSTDSLFFVFDYVRYDKGKQIGRVYRIQIGHGWLTYSFIVMRIHDLSKRERMRENISADTPDYYVSWDFPGYSMFPLKK